MANICLLCRKPYQIELCFLDLVFMRKSTQCLCENCQNAFEVTPRLVCPRCCKKNENVCRDCMNWEKKGYHVNHKSLFVYNSKMKDYFSEYKFHGDYQLCKVFAEELRQTVRKEYSDYLVIPVPLSLERQKERGFNQVIGIIEAGNLDYSDLILKQDVESQSKRNKKERENSVNPFVLKKGIVLPDKVLIVDDIYTTGTTIFQIQDICKVKGAKKIKSISIAR